MEGAVDLRTLEYFLVAAREENITRAAEQLHLTQPTLSRQIRQLERELGCELFTRKNQRIALTPQGILFRQRVQEIVNMARRAKAEAARPADVLEGDILVGCTDAADLGALARAMARFRREHPLVRFTVLSGDNAQVRSQMESGAVDLGLLAEPVSTEGLTCVQMPGVRRWGVLVREDSRFGSLPSMTSRELAGVPLVTVSDAAMHDELTSWSGKDAEHMVAAAHYDLLANAAALVESGVGVAVCAEPTCSYAGLVFVPFSPKLTTASLLSWKSHRALSSASEAFITHMKTNADAEQGTNR